jgi:hypothetical protein
VFEPTGSRRDAASVIFNLPGYGVVDAVDLPLGGRRVKVQPADLEQGCPACGVVSSRVHSWSVQWVRDVPYAGRVAWWTVQTTDGSCSVAGVNVRRWGSQAFDQHKRRARVIGSAICTGGRRQAGHNRRPSLRWSSSHDWTTQLPRLRSLCRRIAESIQPGRFAGRLRRRRPRLRFPFGALPSRYSRYTTSTAIEPLNTVCTTVFTAQCMMFDHIDRRAILKKKNAKIMS